jgi:hypothetical protein
VAVEERPLPEYAALTGAFGAVLGGFLVFAGRRLPERIAVGVWIASGVS